MAYEFVARGFNRKTLLPNRVSIMSSYTAFGSDFNIDLKKFDSMLVFIDREKRLIKFIPTKDDLQAFTIYVEKGKFARVKLTINSKKLNIKSGHYNCSMNKQGELIVDLGEKINAG